MEVSRDEPGRAIELHQESISFWKNGGSGLLMLVPFFMLPIVVVSLVFREPGSSTHPNAWVPIAILALWLAVVALFALYAVTRSRRLALLSANRATGEWVMEDWAPIAFFARRRVLPISAVEWMEVRTLRVFGALEGAALPLQVRLGLRGGGTFELPQRIEVHGLDKRDEVLDLAFRFAHVAGWAHHRVVRNDHLEFHVDVSRAAREGSTPVPPLSGPAEYERDQVGIPAGRLEHDVPPFDPASFASEYRVVRWDPGRDVWLSREATPGQAVRNALGCGGLFLFGTAVVWVASMAWDLPAFLPAVTTTGGLALYGLTVLHYRRRALSGQVRVDWWNRRISIERFGERVEVPFDIVERIEVVALRNEHLSTEGQTPYATYRVQIFARLTRALREAMRTEMIVETKETRDDPETPYRSGLPFGIELARAIGVPCEYRDFK